MASTRLPVIILLSWVLLLPTTVSSEDSIQWTIEYYPIALESLAKHVEQIDNLVTFSRASVLGLKPIAGKNNYYEIAVMESLVTRAIALRPVSTPHKYDIVLSYSDDGSNVFNFITNAQGKYRLGRGVKNGEDLKWFKFKEVQNEFMREVSFWLNWHWTYPDTVE